MNLCLGDPARETLLCDGRKEESESLACIFNNIFIMNGNLFFLWGQVVMNGPECFPLSNCVVFHIFLFFSTALFLHFVKIRKQVR